MNTLLKQIYKTHSVEDEEGNSINPFPTSISSETGAILYQLIKDNNLEKTLEIGMAYGLSSMFICQAHEDKGVGNHTAIDPKQSSLWKSIGLLNIKKAELAEIFRFFEASSDEILPQLVAQKEEFDFAFIDGAHLFDYIMIDFFYIDKLLKIGGYVVFDDLWMPATRKVITFVLRNRAYELVQIFDKIGVRKLVKLQRITRRFFQEPLEFRDFQLKLNPQNICVLKKLAKDKREWDFYRSF
jgi:predicted O-methyltransferase YrrM